MSEQNLHRTHEHFMAAVVSVLWIWHISATTAKCLHTAPLCHLASVTPLYHHMPRGCLYLLPCSFWIMAKPLHHRPWCHLVFKVYICDFSLPLVRALWCDLWPDICLLAAPVPRPGLRNHWDRWKPVSAIVHSNVGPHCGFETVFPIPPFPKKEPSSREEGLRWAAPFPSIRDHEPPISCPCPKLIKKTKNLYPDSLGQLTSWVGAHSSSECVLTVLSLSVLLSNPFFHGDKNLYTASGWGLPWLPMSPLASLGAS